MRRATGRGPDELRAVSITPGYLDYAEGSALVNWGQTLVLCAASVLEQVPPFRQHTGGGWVTGEYGHAAPVHPHPDGAGRPERQGLGPHL